MGHLTLEALARLVSEAPTPEEERHLDGCSDCRSECEALKVQTESIGSLPDLRPPAGDWEALEARLGSEGLIRSGAFGGQEGRWWSSGWIQAAAAVVLFLGGTALGSGVMASGDSSELGPIASRSGLELIPVGTQAQPVSSLPEAVEAVHNAEQQYMLALLQYRQLLDAQGDPSYIGDPTARLAALSAIVASARAGIQQAPADPYVNGVLVGALAEREAVLRTVSATGGERIY